MSRQAIILAGGLGTRLRSAVPDLPKCMAPVHGKPFLHFVIEYLKQQGVDRYIFSLGYMHEVIEEYIHNFYPDLEVEFSVEEEPLGTGGAIKLACLVATEEDVIILNGDTLFEIDIDTFLGFHQEHYAACTLALKPMKNFERYGVVEIDQENHIRSFKEKQYYDNGLINGGVYALHVSSFLELDLPAKFSFEKDYLEVYYKSQKMLGIIEDKYFIDIGIPDDYKRFQSERN